MKPNLDEVSAEDISLIPEFEGLEAENSLYEAKALSQRAAKLRRARSKWNGDLVEQGIEF